MDWGYQREEAVHIEPGDHRVVILNAEESVSTKGNAMIVLTVRPSGSDLSIKHFIVKNNWFNRNMTDFFDSFDVEEGDFQLPGWVGALGAARIEKNEDGYLRVKYFINQEKATELPPWTGEKPERATITKLDGEANENDDGLPF